MPRKNIVNVLCHCGKSTVVHPTDYIEKSPLKSEECHLLTSFSNVMQSVSLYYEYYTVSKPYSLGLSLLVITD